MSYILVTIQNPIRKIALTCFPFAHVVISPYTYKCLYASIGIYMCMALNSYKLLNNRKVNLNYNIISPSYLLCHI